VAVVVALAAASLLSACGSSAKRMTTTEVQSAIAASILAQHGLRTPVNCPDEVERAAGAKFTCYARLHVGAYAVTVTELNERGRVRYGNATPLRVLDSAKVERAIDASILRQRHVRATASCPREVLQQGGVGFRCVVVTRPATSRHEFAVTELDGAGNVRYVGL
jgi:hypothetical protein